MDAISHSGKKAPKPNWLGLVSVVAALVFSGASAHAQALEELIVTATKREENIRVACDAPLQGTDADRAISAFLGDPRT